MKNSFLLQGVVIVALFFGTYISLSKIDWVTLLSVEKISKATEEKLGDIFWDLFHQAEQEIKSDRILKPIDSLLTKICESNNIDRKKIKLHVVRNGEVNAFALPNDHLVVYTGLVEACESYQELSGVIGHELGHMQKRHVMKKLIKEVGMSALISITTGNGGPDLIKETASMLSSKAYDRRLEKEADILAVDYLINSSIHPEPFSDFLFRLSDAEDELTWISTHPDSRERSEYILDYCKGRYIEDEPAISQQTWLNLKESVKQ